MNFILFSSSLQGIVANVAKKIASQHFMFMLLKYSVDYFPSSEMIIGFDGDQENFALKSLNEDSKIILFQCLARYHDKNRLNDAQNRIAELLFLIDYLGKNGFKNISILFTYLGYLRQKNDIPSFSSIFNILDIIWGHYKANQEAKNLSLIIIDSHERDLKRFCKTYKNLSLRNISASDIFASILSNILSAESKNSAILISPDKGSEIDVKNLANRFGVEFARFEKAKCSREIIVHPMFKQDKVQNKHCIIIDDIIDTGATISAVYNSLVDSGAKKITIVVTHGVLSDFERFIMRIEQRDGAKKHEKDLNSSESNCAKDGNDIGSRLNKLNKIYITNTVPNVELIANQWKFVEIIDISSAIAPILSDIFDTQCASCIYESGGESWHEDNNSN